MLRLSHFGLLIGIAVLGTGALAAPPFGGTIFIDRNIVTEHDPSALDSLAGTGRGIRTIYDRRANSWLTIDAFLYRASYHDGLSLEVQVNPEFGSDSAAVEAQKYAWLVGQLPLSLRTDIDAIWINRGVAPFGGGNRSILIHTGQSRDYESAGIIEETLMHEAAHTSLDAYHALAPAWQEAQARDGEFISSYARDFPIREDIAESFLPYFAAQHRAWRLPRSLFTTIVETIPNRVDYFNQQDFYLYPQGECDEVRLTGPQLTVLHAYIAYYGRPADAAGLAYWAARLEDEGGNLDSIIAAFGESAEYQRRFAGLSNEQLILNLYRQLFNRGPDPAGLDFYSAALATGASTLQKISLDVLYGAQGDDLEVLARKLSAAIDYHVNSLRFASEFADVELADLLAPVVDTLSAETACLGIVRGFRAANG